MRFTAVVLGAMLAAEMAPASAWISPSYSSQRRIEAASAASSRLLSSPTTDDFASFAASLDNTESASSPPTIRSTTGSTTPASAAKSARQSSSAVAKQPQRASEKNQTWQEDLEELLDPITSPARRQILLSDLMAENADIRASVQSAIRDRKIDPLLTPTGKKIREGTRAVARQLANDILPSLVAASSRSRSSSSPLLPFVFAPPPPDQVTKIGNRLWNALQNQVQTGLQTLQQDLQDPVTKIPQRVARQSQDFFDQAANVLKETPAGLQEPSYTTVATTAEYEIRDYAGYTVACTNIMTPDDGNLDDDDAASPSSPYYSPDTSVGPTAAAFNSLAAYLFGANRQQKVLAMTTPVTTTMTGEMRFYLAKNNNNNNNGKDDNADADTTTTSAFPDPLEQDESKNVYQQGTIRVQEIPPARLAVRRFTGFVTNGEIARQKEALLAALALDGRYELDVAHGQTVGHVIFQYNPPFTLPVIRRNEIAVPILLTNDDDDDDNKSSSGSSDAATVATAVTSGSSLSDSWVSAKDETNGTA